MSVSFSNMNGGSGRTGELVVLASPTGISPVKKETKQANKPHCQANLLSPTEKCKVCKEPAAKHIHYGAMTCFSCRAFFRRSIQNKTSGTYVCRRSQNCDISLKTRKNCQFCRYQLCLRVGMKPSWVLSEEERSRRFKKQRQKAKDKQLVTDGGDSIMADDDDEEFIRNSGEFDMGNFCLDGDNIEAFVSLSEPVTISSQPIMSGPSQIQQLPTGQRQMFEEYSQHPVKLEQDIKQEPQYISSPPPRGPPESPGPAGQTIVVQRRKFDNMGGVMTVLVENRQKRQDSVCGVGQVNGNAANGSNVIVRFPPKDVSSPMSLSNISSAVDGISQSILSPDSVLSPGTGLSPGSVMSAQSVKPHLVSESSTSSRFSMSQPSPAPSVGSSSVTSGIHSPSSSLCPSPVTRMEMNSAQIDDSMDVSVFEEHQQYQLQVQEAVNSQEVQDPMGVHPLFERMGSLNPLPPVGSPQYEHPNSHATLSIVYPGQTPQMAPQKRPSFSGPASNPRDHGRLHGNVNITRPTQQQQNMGSMGLNQRVTQHDPRVSQHDPRVMQHDPRVMQHDPRVTQHDHRVTQHNPRVSQHQDSRVAQHDPRVVQHDSRATHQDSRVMQVSQHDPRAIQQNQRVTQNGQRVTQHQTGSRVTQHQSINVLAPQQQQHSNGQQISHPQAPQQVISLHQHGVCHPHVVVSPSVATIPEEIIMSPSVTPRPTTPIDQDNFIDNSGQPLGIQDTRGQTKNLQNGGRIKNEVHFCSIAPCDSSRYFNSFEDAKLHMRSVHQSDSAPQSILIYDEENPEDDEENDKRSLYSEEHYTTSSEDEDSTHPNMMCDPSYNEPEIIFGDDEKDALRDVVRKHDERYRSVNFGEALIKEMIMCSMFGIPISANAALAGYRLSVERITRIAHDLNSFRTLAKDDQSSLLKENADLLVSLRSCVFFDARKKGVDQVLISMGIDDMETIKNVFKPIMKEGTSQLKHIDYKTFNSIQTITDSATEVRYNFLQEKVAQQVSPELGDDVIPILLTYIILFSCDMTSLADRQHVEKIQDQYTRMLQRYLYSKHPRRTASLFLAEALCSITRIREMAEIKKKRMINSNVKI